MTLRAKITRDSEESFINSATRSLRRDGVYTARSSARTLTLLLPSANFPFFFFLFFVHQLGGDYDLNENIDALTVNARVIRLTDNNFNESRASLNIALLIASQTRSSREREYAEVGKNRVRRRWPRRRASETRGAAIRRVRDIPLFYYDDCKVREIYDTPPSSPLLLAFQRGFRGNFEERSLQIPGASESSLRRIYLMQAL